MHTQQYVVYAYFGLKGSKGNFMGGITKRWLWVNAWGLCVMAQAVEFNANLLATKEPVDLSQFSTADYVVPGEYQLQVMLNQRPLDARDWTIVVKAHEDTPTRSAPCLTTELINMLGLTAEANAHVQAWSQGECLSLDQISDAQVQIDQGQGRLMIAIPQAWLAYQDPRWVPPSRWDHGETGGLLDYNVTASLNNTPEEISRRIGAYGTLGFNYGAWRARGDFQSVWDSSNTQTQNAWDVSRLYAYRVLPDWQAKLTLGEQYLSSSLFDSFRFTGVILASDERMLPPALRGYSPDVIGVARTNARVQVRQGDRIIYESMVPPGPFQIRDLPSGISGTLTVEVYEQDGQVQRFEQETASIPYLTRPGMLRYQLYGGRPSSIQHQLEGALFNGGEFSWGISNSLSLYGGALFTDGYNALSFGMGRDLGWLGAAAADLTHSWAQLPQGSQIGNAYRINYAKRFVDWGSQIAFAGYRFSERGYVGVNEFLHAQQLEPFNDEKAAYSIRFSQALLPAGLTLSLDYHRSSYWEKQGDQSRYQVMLNQPFSVGGTPVQASLTLTRVQDPQGDDDHSAYLSLSIPFGDEGRLSYQGQRNQDELTQAVTYNSRDIDGTQYSLSTSSRDGGRPGISAYVTQVTDWADLQFNIAHDEDRYAAVGGGVRGGITATEAGMVSHRSNLAGGTRLMLDADGISDVSVEQGKTHTNGQGLAVLSDVGSYTPTLARVDIDRLSDDVEAHSAVIETVLTEGAIGVGHYEFLQGGKALMQVRRPDGSVPPFGADVVDQRGRRLAVVGDEGEVYLAGIQSGAQYEIRWPRGGCRFVISDPKILTVVCN
ncbi:fimbria/pilus outer membrane usher protein [Aeromonas sobria]|nr:fimbria/pilus outer membrane usher protein [Aeromonas sobria]